MNAYARHTVPAWISPSTNLKSMCRHARAATALRLKNLGYEIETGVSGQPEIKGYTQEYMEASSPRRQQIKRHLEEAGHTSAEAAQIAAHRTREAKLNISREAMQERHRKMAAE